MFIDRVEELKNLREKLTNRDFEFIVIYGRRRIGKTRLIIEALKDLEHVYYLAVEGNNLRYFKNNASRIIPEIKYLEEDWENYFRILKNKIIVIDEFPNLVLEDKKVLSIFQRIIDLELKDTRSKIIISGSSISMMSDKILSYKSPLYGRRTGSLKLKPLKIWDIKDFFPNVDPKQLVEIYGFADGIPYYLERIKPPFWRWLKNDLYNPYGFVKDEMNYLMRYEFEEVTTYKKILEAIAIGKRTPKEIRDYLGIKHSDITPYLKNLIETGFIRRVTPVTEDIKSKKGRYYIRDNFTRFWFRYIQPNLSAIEEKIFDVSTIKNDYPTYLGRVFEDIAIQYLIKLNRENKTPFKFNKIGGWWHKNIEIDIVALDKRNILFGECKWQNNINAEKIAEELLEKSKYVQWYNDEREEYLVIFAKTFKKRINEYKNRKVYCFDLKDMEERLTLTQNI